MIRSLRLQDFRCFGELACELGEGMTAFVGANAQGKTSVLEAVCVLLRLQSPRARTRGEMVKFETGGFGVAGRVGERELKFRSRGGGRELWLDGEAVERAGDYLAASGLVVWMGNDDLELVKGPGEVRRRYLDFLAAQIYPEYRVAVRDYEKALRSRNRLLKDFRVNWSQVDAYTAVLVRHGEVIVRCRRELIGELSPVASGAHGEIGGNGETLAIGYQPGADGELGDALEATRAIDERRRMTTAGPHRDDFDVLVNGMPAGRFASEGQQRTVALALKLAQARELEAKKGRVPVLLLDDIFGELDPRRRNLLLGALPEGSQKLVTTTHLDWAESGVSPDVVYSVSAGSVSRAG